MRRRELVRAGTLVAPLALGACGPAGAQDGGGAGAGSGSKAPATVVVHSRAGAADHSAFQQTRIPLFKEQHPTIEVRYEDIPGGEMRTKLLVLAAGGSIGDLAWNGTFVGSHELLAKGTFQPVERFIKADKFDTRPYLAASLDAQRHQGQLHGLPFIGHYGCNAIYYNEDLLTRSGVPLPPADASWTVDDLVDRARRIVGTGNAAGFVPATGIQECGTAWLRTFGGELLSADGKRGMIDSPESIAALQWLHDAVHKLQLAPTYANARREFEDSKLAMMQATLGQVAEFRLPASKTKEFRWGVTVIPKGPGGKRGTMGTGTGYALTRLSKAPEASWEWTKFITNKESGIEQVYGGGGSPGARTDVWNDPRLLALNPIFGTMVRVFGQPGPFHAPHNTRTDEINKAVDAALQPLWDGKIAPRDAARSAQEAISQILSQPL
ncbi:MAG TPA: sugar ABC transporter substrate-binding protein [Chloroflexota bacterium]|jgi:multiple sugar transport system substrate-binding protein|nr:sugar ABC transporter substrate-binding protein [Chloroflexota bacterium]